MNPPRAVFLDFPLGHTAGKVHDRALQRKVMIDTLSALDSIQIPGTIRDLPYQWSDDDDWKERVMRPDGSGRHRDDRTSRTSEPQYQTESDRIAAEALLGAGGCASCFYPD